MSPLTGRRSWTYSLENLQSAFDAVRDMTPQPPRPQEIFLNRGGIPAIC